MNTSRSLFLFTLSFLLIILASGCRLFTDLSGHWLIYRITADDIVLMDNENYVLGPYNGFYGRVEFGSSCYLIFSGNDGKCECHQDFSLFEPKVRITTDCKLIEGEFMYSSFSDSMGNRHLLLTDSTRKIYLQRLFSR